MSLGFQSISGGPIASGKDFRITVVIGQGELTDLGLFFTSDTIIIGQAVLTARISSRLAELQASGLRFVVAAEIDTITLS